MKRLAVFLCLMLLTPLIYSQTSFTFPISIEFPSTRSAWTFQPNPNKMLWIAQNSGKIEVRELNDKMEVIKQKTIPVLDKVFSEFHGGVLENGIYHLLFSHGSNRKIYTFLQYDPHEGTAQFQAITNVDKKERFLASKEHKGKLYLITANKKTSALVIREISSASNIKTGVFSLTAHFAKDGFYTFWQNLKPTMGGLGGGASQIAITVVDSSGIDHLQIDNDKIKLYFLDKIYLTADTNDGLNHVKLFELDIATSQKKIQTIAYPAVSGITQTGNSFIYRNKLFLVKTGEDYSKISIRDMKSNNFEELANFEINDKDEKIDFANTPIIREGTWWGADDSRVLKKVKQLTKKMVQHNSIITVSTTTDNQIAMSVGSYTYQAPNNGTWTTMPVGNFGSAPVFIGGWNSRNAYVTNSYFRSKLSADSLQHLSGKMKQSTKELKEDATERFESKMKMQNTFIKLHCDTQFELGNKLYYGYYKRDEKVYYITEILTF